MPEISINVQNKIARANGNPQIVCGNSDYTVSFEFDSEWEAYPVKTARYAYCKRGVLQYEDVLFEDSTAPVPVLHDIDLVAVGVYAGNLHTTTPARILCVSCITDGAPVHMPPTPDVYNQLLQYLAMIAHPEVFSYGFSVPITNGAITSISGETTVQGD